MILGASPGRLVRELGTPDADRRRDESRWMVFSVPGAGVLRVRCRKDPVAGEQVASWSLKLREPAETLREAAERAGLWPQLSPDVRASEVEEPVVRRRLELPDGREASATAGVRGDRFSRIAVFDEAPEW